VKLKNGIEIDVIEFHRPEIKPSDDENRGSQE